MEKIDDIDTKILKMLLEDGRKSFASISKEINLTKVAIAKRYQEMKKAGIIVGATIQYNYQKFGYSGVAMILLSVESLHVNNILEHLQKIPNISSFRYYNAAYNLAAISKLKNLRDLQYVKEVMSRESPTLEIKTYVWTDVRNTPENILPNTFGREPQIHGEKNSNAETKIPESSSKLDELDIQIVEKLTKNGRVSLREIAQELRVSTDTIARRYENLRKNNFIKVSIQINPTKLGFQAILDVKISLSVQNQTNYIADKLIKITGVSYLVKISGDYDLLLSALVRDCDDIIRINEEIAKISHIKKIEATMRKIRTDWPGPRQYISTF
jgi:DNA-binding Lrp family transcriptional regulator